VNSREPRHNVAMRPPRNRRKLRNVLKKKSFAPQKVELQFLEKHKTLYLELHRDFTKGGNKACPIDISDLVMLMCCVLG